MFTEVGKIKSEAEVRESNHSRASEELDYYKSEASRLEQQLAGSTRDIERLERLERELQDHAGEREGLMLQLQAKDQELEHYKSEVAR